MTSNKTLTRIAGFAAALLVNAAMFLAADRSIGNAGAVLIDHAPVVQLDRVVITADRPARTAATSELSSNQALQGS